ncbi:MAG: hypothetical protein WBB68_02665 [Candidatus Moraniibacteriota bacterium]
MSQDMDWYQRFSDAVSHNLPPPEVIGEEIALGWLNNQSALRQFLAGLFLSGKDIKQLSQCNPGLAGTELPKWVSSVTIPASTEPINLAAFFSDRDGLVVDDDLVDRIGRSVCQTVGPTSGHRYLGMTIEEAVHYLGIREKLPEPSTLQDIAGLIIAQWSGQSGFLHTDGSENKAVVRLGNDVFYVNIIWMRCGNEWFVCENELDENDNCPADSQFICPSNVAL